jgi:hypothetical protein
MRMVLPGKAVRMQPGFIPEPDTGWKPTLLFGVSSDLPERFLRGVPRTHRYHATVLVS